MAINYELINRGGISLSTNFELLSEKPLDSRLVVPSLDGLQNYIDNGAAYEGMIAYVSEEKKHYRVIKNGTKLEYEIFNGTASEGSDYVKINDPIMIEDATEEISTSITSDGMDVSSPDRTNTFSSKGIQLSSDFQIWYQNDEGKFTLDMSEDLIEQFKNILDVNQGQGLEDGTVLNGGTASDWNLIVD